MPTNNIKREYIENENNEKIKNWYMILMIVSSSQAISEQSRGMHKRSAFNARHQRVKVRVVIS